MTLLEYFALTNDVARALAAVEHALAESPDEVELLAARLAKACEELSKAKCSGAG